MSGSSYNSAQESVITQGASGMWDRLARPLADHVFTPIGESNHAAGVVALNGLLTAPRLLKPLIGSRYIEHVEAGESWRAVGDIAAGTALDASDGIDGAVARRSALTSEVGTGLDSLADAVSIWDDNRRVNQRAQIDNDTFVISLMKVDSRLKIANIALGGIGNKLSAVAVERQGIVLEPWEQAHSVPLGKAGFAAGSAAKKLLMIGYAFPPKSTARKLWRSAGIGLSIASMGLCAGGTIQYTAAIGHRINKLRKH